MELAVHSGPCGVFCANNYSYYSRMGSLLLFHTSQEYHNEYLRYYTLILVVMSEGITFLIIIHLTEKNDM